MIYFTTEKGVTVVDNSPGTNGQTGEVKCL